MDLAMALTPSTALVTGAASGIGAAIARLLAARGSHVVCIDSNAAQLEAEVAAIISAGGSAEAVPLDLADAPAVAAFAASTTAVDQLALCAGIYRATPADGFDLDTYNRVVDVNLTGAVNLLMALVPRLAESAAPRVVSISSIQSSFGEAGSTAYAVSKAGLVAATKVLSTELAGRGILVNAIAPGFIDTPMATLADGTSEHDSASFTAVYVEAGKLPLGRAGTPDEVALAAGFLLSPDNTYITGHVLVVDGGLTATF